jgi:hypothetical protein
MPVPKYDDHQPARPEMALYGIYEISKILGGPGSLPEILITTLNVLKSFLDMGNGLIALLDNAGEAEMVSSGSSSRADARHYFDALPKEPSASWSRPRCRWWSRMSDETVCSSGTPQPGDRPV